MIDRDLRICSTQILISKMQTRNLEKEYKTALTISQKLEIERKIRLLNDKIEDWSKSKKRLLKIKVKEVI